MPQTQPSPHGTPCSVEYKKPGYEVGKASRQCLRSMSWLVSSALAICLARTFLQEAKAKLQKTLGNATSRREVSLSAGALWFDRTSAIPQHCWRKGNLHEPAAKYVTFRSSPVQPTPNRRTFPRLPECVSLRMIMQQVLRRGISFLSAALSPLAPLAVMPHKRSAMRYPEQHAQPFTVSALDAGSSLHSVRHDGGG